MQLDRKQIKLDVRAYLKGKWFIAALAIILVFGVVGAVFGCAGAIAWIPVINGLAGLAALVAASPLFIALAAYFLQFARGNSVHLEEIITSLKDRYYSYMGAFWWRALWTWLWSLLLLVPGIIKFFAYSFTPYIIFENPGLGAQRALKLSIAITSGHKGQLFVLYLSFIGWFLLCGITFGILSYYVDPYFKTTYAVYYEKLKAAAIAEGKVDPADFVVVQA